ncbi:hypothetical protein niasHT_010404 [Heterodera trifolii]|uniref:MATH domain-containing protein n=1 Tax=Heterodera trifolii TaxID=157864 RepID=A0ABD2MAP6_9BILA
MHVGTSTHQHSNHWDSIHPTSHHWDYNPSGIPNQLGTQPIGISNPLGLNLISPNHWDSILRRLALRDNTWSNHVGLNPSANFQITGNSTHQAQSLGPPNPFRPLQSPWDFNPSWTFQITGTQRISSSNHWDSPYILRRQSLGLNPSAFQSLGLNPSAFQSLGLNQSAQSLGLNSPTSITGTQPIGIPITGTQPIGIPITGTQPVGIPITGTQPISPITGTQPITTQSLGLNPSAFQSLGLNVSAFQSLGLNPSAFQPLGLNPSAFQSLDSTHQPNHWDSTHHHSITGTQPIGIPTTGTQRISIPIHWDSTHQHSNHWDSTHRHSNHWDFKPSAFESLGLNPSAFQSLGLNPPAFKSRDLTSQFAGTVQADVEHGRRGGRSLFASADCPHVIEVTDVEAEAFKVMLSFIYAEDLSELNGQNAMAVLYAVSSCVLTTEEVIGVFQFHCHPNLCGAPGQYSMAFPCHGRISDQKKGTLSMQIEKLSEFAREEVNSSRLSKHFYIKGLPWKILAKKNAKKDSTEKWLGFFLCCTALKQDGNWSCKWSCKCSATHRIASLRSGTENLSSKYDHVFNNEVDNWGFPKFHCFYGEWQQNFI